VDHDLVIMAYSCLCRTIHILVAGEFGQ